MPSYIYEVVDSAGNNKTETIDAANEAALVDKLQNEGFFVVSIRLAKDKAVAVKTVRKETGVKFAHEKCKIEDLLVFSRQLATMLEAGVTMLRTLDVIITQIRSKQLYTAVSQIRADIEQGSSLSAALAKHPKIFNQFWVSLAEVGEASGTMPLILNKLADHVEQDAAFRTAIVSAMVYPLILFVVCIGAVIFFALVVGPKFEEVFTSMHAQLPLMTKMLLNFFNFLKKYLFLLGAGFAGIVFLIRGYIATPIGQLQFEKLIYQMPILGDVTKLIVVERFSSQMSILVESGVPILYSLEITQKLVENKTCSLILAEVRAGVSEGKGIADALLDEEFFPIMAVQMIKVGEETGELGKMLKHVAHFYQAQVEAFMKRFGTIIEPFMLVFMAAMIGTIVIAIFLPLFKLGGNIHGH